MLRRRTVLAAMVVAVFVAAPARAQNSRAAARDLAGKWQDAVVNVRVALKIRASMRGREAQSSDDTIEAIGTVIDPGGLTVVSLGSINPGGMMTKLMGAGAAAGVEISTEATDVKIRLADGREMSATIALRDEDLNLAFIRPTEPPDKPLVAIDLADAAQPAMLDEVVVIGRLGRVGGWAPAAALRDIGGIIRKPRTFFVLAGEAASVGTPAFLMNGRVVGVLTVRQIETGRRSALGAMNGSEGLGLLAVILPAADVLEIAKQASEKK